MPGKIRELDAVTREQIAAGEVIERPASAVKELVENALDADASRVDVSVEAGGTDAITVADDGIGMDRAGVRAAVREHTTSKIETIDDLAAGLATLGFRGEALHAIGAVSRMTITTKPRDDDHAEGTELVVEGGDVTDVSPAGRAPGTTVSVEDLFFNVPARRKYLKQPSTEFSHVNTIVTSYALANPDVAVSLIHDGRETFATTGQGELREAVLSVYGRDVARAMIDVPGDDSDPADALPDGPLDGVEGLVSHPETTRAGSEYCTAFVNGRYVRSSVVRDAVVEAYGTQLAPDRYPFAVLFLSVDPGAVDVNVHPRKLEIRFADEEGVREQVRSAVEDALLSAGLIRSSAPRGRSAPEQATIAPDEGDEPSEAGHTSHRDPADRSSAAGSQSEPTDRTRAASSVANEPSAETTSTEDTAPAGDKGATTGTEVTTDADVPTGRDDPHSDVHSHTRIRGGEHQTRLGDAEPDQSFETLPAMRILGQYRDTYVVAETDDGLLLIDQHAADERVNYERLTGTVATDPAAQQLAEPVTVELTAREAAAVEGRADELERLGFRADLGDDRHLTVTAVPAALAEADAAQLVRDVCSALAESEAAADATVTEAIDVLLADLACYPSITGKTSLMEGSIRNLLDALDDCENPYSCPHGRPVLIELDADELEARFERDYPGHGGRRDD